MPRTGVSAKLPDIGVTHAPKRSRPRKTSEPKPIAPYNSNPRKGLGDIFDRVSGQPVGVEQLKTYIGGIETSIDVAWWIDSPYRRQHFGSETVDVLASLLESNGVTGIGPIRVIAHGNDYYA